MPFDTEPTEDMLASGVRPSGVDTHWVVTTLTEGREGLETYGTDALLFWEIMWWYWQQAGYPVANDEFCTSTRHLKCQVENGAKRRILEEVYMKLGAYEAGGFEERIS
jgi:hypothetical protein